MDDIIFINIKLFAIYRERIGQSYLELSLPDNSTLDSAIESILEAFPRLEPLITNTIFAVNQEYVDGSHLLKSGDELVLIPPVSGGSN